MIVLVSFDGPVDLAVMVSHSPPLSTNHGPAWTKPGDLGTGFLSVVGFLCRVSVAYKVLLRTHYKGLEVCGTVFFFSFFLFWGGGGGGGCFFVSAL